MSDRERIRMTLTQCNVEIEHHDETTKTIPFTNRLAAERFVFEIPIKQRWLVEDGGRDYDGILNIRRAKITPLNISSN